MSSESTENRIWEKIIKVAQEDGRISSEESTLIRSILESAQNYERVLNLAIEDGEITQEEKKELIDMRANLLDRAYRVASNDHKISDDEYAIIEELLRILHELELEEEKFTSS